MEGCRKVVQERVLNEMLGSIQDPTGGGWKALVLDSTTTRILSAAMRMSDILEAGVSVVEDIAKRREPLPLAAVYFISPSPSSVAHLVADFESKPLYPSVHVFFSSGVTQDVVDRIKRCRVLLPLLKTLKEVNMEFTVVDARTFVTGHPHTLIRCMGERSEASQQEFEGELDSIAARLCTTLITLHDTPAIRYRVGKPPEAGDVPGAAPRSLLAQRLAQKVGQRTSLLQRSGGLPQRETCELLILDRSVDPVAPVIHEWTYEALVYDLLSPEDNVIRYQAETAAGGSEVKEHLLDESTDELWAELRHSHIADVYTTLSRRFNDFQDKNKAAQYQRGAAAGGQGINTGNIKALIKALPQFRDVLGRLSVHIFISSELKNAINSRMLTELGELEQNLVYGDSGSQELIKFLQEYGDALAPVDKMRLFMSYLATHPEKLDPVKKQQWAKLARLDAQDMDTVCNLAYLNVAVMKQPGSQASKGLSFSLRGPRKKKATYRKREGRGGADEQYTLARFDPVLLDVMEDAVAGKLSQDEYPYIRETNGAAGDEYGLGDPATRATSARQNRSAVFGLRRGSEAAQSGPSSIYNQVTGGMAGLGLGGAGAGRRLLVFVIGGVTRSEMRAVHELSRRTGRDILLGSTAVLKPTGFLSQLRSIGSPP